ncbi:helix-turn-helix transcriptional regulator [Chelativorans xinjiangense]|uniref:helix-turn-helix transcriptional regulator n=1 Tax=Chelativorans xinjiangense TaxID=2681485 RepID=UPI0013577D60|nr:hypothetical protein [Chelativorans xinjiangense]
MATPTHDTIDSALKGLADLQAEITMGDPARQLLRLKEVIRMAPFQKTKVYEEIQKGRLRTFKHGRSTLVRLRDYHAWLDLIESGDNRSENDELA